MRTEPPTGDELERMLASMKGNVLDRVGDERPATPERRQLTDRVIGAVVAVALLLGLGTAGAAVAFSIIPQSTVQPEARPNDTSTATPRPSAAFPIATGAPTPTTPPVDPLALVTAIVVRPDRLDLQDAGGTVLRTLSYDDDTASFVEALTAVLDEAPIVEDSFSGSDLVNTTYTWRGLTVSDSLRTGLGYPVMNLGVTFDLPTLGDGVGVTTVSGFAPGDDLARFAASVGAKYHEETAQNLIALESGPERGPSSVPGRINAYAVVGSDYGAGSGEPSLVFAPFNFGHEQGTHDQTW